MARAVGKNSHSSIAPVRGDRTTELRAKRIFFRRYAARILTCLPQEEQANIPTTADAVGYLLPLLRSYGRLPGPVCNYETSRFHNSHLRLSSRRADAL